MLLSFSISQRGAGHVDAGRECQDASRTRVVTGADGREYAIAAIADGVGSADASRQGAKVAVATAVACLQAAVASGGWEGDDETHTEVLRQAFAGALKAVEDAAEAEGVRVASMDSTLTVAVYDGSTLWFAHRGDDGIVVMHDDGTYGMVTERHKGADANTVRPLRSVTGWQFGTCEHVASFVMLTDGMLDYCVDKPVMNNRVYYPFLYPLLNKEISDPDEMGRYRTEWVKYLWGDDGSKPKDGGSRAHGGTSSDDGGPSAAEGDGDEAQGAPLGCAETEGDDAAEDASADGGESGSDEDGAPRVRDAVFDDITVVLVQNPDSVRDLPPFSFDFDRWERDTRRRAQTRDAALARAASERMEEQIREVEERRAAEAAPVRHVEPTQDVSEDVRLVGHEFAHAPSGLAPKQAPEDPSAGKGHGPSEGDADVRQGCAWCVRGRHFQKRGLVRACLTDVLSALGGLFGGAKRAVGCVGRHVRGRRRPD